MPYDAITELPDSVRNVLPEAAQRIWLKAFNSTLSRGESEDTARRIAWGAVKQAGYSKGDNGKWSKMSETTHLFVSEIFDPDSKHPVKYERSADGEQLVRGLPLMKPGFWNGHEYSLTELREVADNFEQLQSDADYEPALMPFHTYDKEGDKTNIDAREIQGYFADVYVDDDLGWLLGDVRVVDDELVQNMMRGKFRYTSTELADYEESGLTLVNTAWVDNPAIKGMPWELVMNREEFPALQDSRTDDTEQLSDDTPAQGGDNAMTFEEFKDAVEELLAGEETPEVFADLTVEQLQDFWPAVDSEGDEDDAEEDDAEQLAEDAEEIHQLKTEIDELKAENEKQQRKKLADDKVRELMDGKHIFPAQQDKVRKLLANAESEEQVEELVDTFADADLSIYFEQQSETRDTDAELADAATESVARVTGKGGE